MIAIKKQTSRRAVVVLGMHRSGTSILSALLCSAGADAPKHLQGGDKFNRTGYWESQRLWPLHDELLREMGVAWDTVVSFPATFFRSPIAIRYKARIIEVLRDEYADSALFCVKDPRISRLLPIWMPLLKDEGITADYVIMTRNPLEVAQSLKRRNGFHRSQSLMLWLRHTLEAEHHTRGHRRVFVTYDQIMSDWHCVLQRISERLDITWPRQALEIDVEFDRIVADGERHHWLDVDKLSAREDLPEWVLRTYRACIAASEDEESAQLEVFDRLRHEMATASKAFEPLLVMEQMQRRESEERRDELAEQTLALRSEVSAGETRTAQIVAELGQRETELAAMQAAIETARAQTTAAESQHAALQTEAAALVTRATERDAELGAAQTKLSEMEAAAAAAEARTAQIVAELGQRETELAAMQAAI
ncbi:MAG: sulfotransferase, partial [Candidatus Tumulicola sp.]